MSYCKPFGNCCKFCSCLRFYKYMSVWRFFVYSVHTFDSHVEQNLRTWNCNSSVLIVYALPLYCLQRSKYFIRFWQSLSHVCIFVITFSAYKWHISDPTDERCEIDVPLVWLASLYELCNNTLFMFAWNNKPSVVPGIRPPLKYLIHW